MNKLIVIVILSLILIVSGFQPLSLSIRKNSSRNNVNMLLSTSSTKSTTSTLPIFEPFNMVIYYYYYYIYIYINQKLHYNNNYYYSG